MNAKAQVQEFDRVLKKTLQAYRMRLNLMYRRNQILSEISKKGLNPKLIDNLRNTLRREKNLIDIILTEDDLEKNNIVIAIDTLKKLEKEPAVLEELKKRKIDHRKLEEGAKVGLKILKYMARRLKHIEKRILLEESLLKDTSPKNFKEYLNVWRKEIRDEEKFRKFIHRKTSTKIYGNIAIGGFITAFIGIPLAAIGVTGIIFAIGTAAAINGFIHAIRGIVEESQKPIDFQSRDILKALKKAA
ncbi:DUF2207 domain-containing protein [Candidatus Woesearchaeota archaeon]|nr:DUF2207 domain-containing protein [Candidatus Woesearchaeota archaeon]